jgi:phage FluMu gp28-like protein
MASKDKREPRTPNPEPRKILLPYQQKWVSDKAPLKIWMAARQIGKSFSIAMEAVAEALEHKCNNLILSSSDRQSKEVMQKVYSHLRYLKVRSDDIIKSERETREEVLLPNGSRIISLPGNPDTVRGFSGNVFLDEFAFHKDTREIWQAMYPTVTRGFKIRITSTPNGKLNMFYDLWHHNDQFSKHMTDIYTACREGLKVDVEELRKGIGDPDAWAQEYECQFVDEATAYITYEMITSCEDEMATMDLPSDFIFAGRELYQGIDIGRKQDLTIFWLWEKVGDVFWTRMVKKLYKAPFRLQRDELYSYLPLLRRCCSDATGMGMQLAEEAIEKYGSKVEAVVFTNAVKEDLAVTFRRKFEDRQVRIPIDRDVREDLRSRKCPL